MHAPPTPLPPPIANPEDLCVVLKRGHRADQLIHRIGFKLLLKTLSRKEIVQLIIYVYLTLLSTMCLHSNGGRIEISIKFNPSQQKSERN